MRFYIYLTTGAITDVLEMNETKEGIKPISNQRAGFEAAKVYRQYVEGHHLLPFRYLTHMAAKKAEATPRSSI